MRRGTRSIYGGSGELGAAEIFVGTMQVLHAQGVWAPHAWVGIPCTLEPASIAVNSNIRGDIKFSRISTRRADQYADVITYERVKTT